MKPLQPPDSLHLKSAEGWLELGNPREAAAELEKISKTHHSHSDVLEVRWRICAETRDWESGVTVARAIIQQDPESSAGWISLSFALHELKMTQQAWDSLFAIAGKFPKEPTIAYNLACYGAQLGKLWEAEQWLRQAFKTGDPSALKRLALSDTDLKPFWDKIAAS
jgi:predicted Zn-dependent protease